MTSERLSQHFLPESGMVDAFPSPHRLFVGAGKPQLPHDFAFDQIANAYKSARARLAKVSRRSDQTHFLGPFTLVQTPKQRAYPRCWKRDTEPK